MDKREYQEKLDEINRLIALEDYAAAARVADSIDWKRVRNVQTLIMVSEIYEAVERYEDSKVLLLRAYRRSPLGRTVLYRLVECTIRLGQFDEAIEYYSEYVQAAPHDNNKYILKYKIYRSRGSSLDEQIDILKQYLDQEYNEKWAYELAKLQIAADRVQDGLSTCDDLVLWFHSGKYVIKALELKRRYAPLTPKQQEIYDNRFNEPDEAGDEADADDTSYLQQAQSLAKAGRAAAEQEEIKSELARDISRAAQRRAAEEEAAEASAQKEEAEAPAQKEDTAAVEIPAEAPAAERTEAAAETAAIEEAVEEAVPAEVSAVKTDTAAEKETAEEVTVTEEASAAEEASEQEEAAVQAEAPSAEANEAARKALEETAAQMRAEAVEAARAEEQEEERDQQKLQEDMIRSMREIVSGVGPKDEPGEEEARIDEAIEQSKEDQENAVAARGADRMFRVPASEASRKRTAGKLTIDDILLSMSDGGERVRQVTGGNVLPAVEKTASDEAEVSAAEEKDPEVPRFLKEEVREAKQTQELPVQEISDAAEAMEAEHAVQEESGNTYAVQEEPGNTYAELPQLEHVPFTKEIAEAKTKKLPVEEIRKLHEAFLNGSDPAQVLKQEAAPDDAAAERAVNQAPDFAASTETAESKAVTAPTEAEASEAAAAPDTVTEATENTAPEAEQVFSVPQGDEEQPDEPAEAVVGQPEEADSSDQSEEIASSDQSEETADEVPDESAAAEQPDEAVPSDQPEPSAPAPKGVPAQDAQELEGSSAPYYGAKPMLKESQKELFAGFLSIGTLEEQIAGAIAQAESKQGEKTSKSGNILILGAHGCGKTTIATGIAKAIAEDMGTRSVKMARIYAADLNRKDIAATIAKIAGGVLIVEEAGDLDDAIVDQLTTAMEFRTDGLIVILEDEQRYIHDLLMRHPRFTMKFTAQIYIPAYSTDDLVNFGRIYALNRDYVLSEGAAAAFYDRVEAAAQTGESVSITNVAELVDRAMKNANGFFRRIGSAKKRYDEEDRVILLEKDFR